MFTSVLALAESISARRSASVSCRGTAQSLRAASNIAPCSTKELVESITKWWAESGDEDRRCALISCSAWSLSSMKVLMPQHVPSNCFDGHQALVIGSDARV